jgi:hypothetical protein
MKTTSLLALATLLLPAGAAAQDPAHTDGDKYKVLLDNQHVRVLEYTDRPGERTHLHRHPAFVVYALGPFQRALHFPDGRVARREFKAGDVLYSGGEMHVGENVGTTPTRVLMVEIKDPRQP